MHNDTVETFEHEGYTIRIRYDADMENPIQDEHWEMVKVVIWHKDYDFGNCKDFATPEDFEVFCKEHTVTRLPVYLYDHSGLTVSTGPFGCPWDSGQVGWVFITDEGVKEAGIKEVQKSLEGVVQTLDDYLTGKCYGYEIIKRCSCCGQEAEVLDSCWGFFGDLDQADGVKDAAKESAGWLTQSDADQRNSTYAI